MYYYLKEYIDILLFMFSFENLLYYIILEIKIRKNYTYIKDNKINK